MRDRETETDRERGGQGERRRKRAQENGGGIILTALVIHSTKISERNGDNAFLGM